MDRSLPGSSVHETSKTRILEWAGFPSLGDLPNPGNELESPALQANSLPSKPPGKPYMLKSESENVSHSVVTDSGV